MRLARLAPLALAACATAGGGPPPEPPRAAELARVQCLLVAPLENVSDVGLGAEAAVGAVLASIDPDRTRVYPVRELRALFRDTALELPEGIPPSLALELADILGADAALYGAVEGHWRSAERRLIVTLRLSLAGTRELLFADTIEVIPAPGESPEGAVRRSVEEATRPVFSRLGSPPAPRQCYDSARFAQLRALATGQGARTPPPARSQPPAAATAPPAAPAAAQARLPKPVPPRNARQADWARRLAARERFVVEGVTYDGRSARLGRTAGLSDLAGALAASPEVNVRLEAFVDATPDPDQDAQLSLQMAQAAGQRLADLGVSRERISLAGRAGERPILPNFTAKGRAANRRIEAVGLK
ncbi:MAG TPA: OmpA family protein [Anaeromyxobacteraceae bacterium]|nr:OmpA family protein [Anaeromyxobacteraceae bacterium]